MSKSRNNGGQNRLKAKDISPSRYGLLIQAAQQLSDFRAGKTKVGTKDIVQLMLIHGARARRCAKPIANVRIQVNSPREKTAVRLQTA